MTKAASWSQGTSFRLSSMTEIRARVSLSGISQRHETLLLRYLHPQEGTNISDLGGRSSQRAVRDGRNSGVDLLLVLLVGVDGAREGVSRKSDGSSTRRSRSASSDGTVLDGRREGERASGGGCQESRVDSLHDAELKAWRCRAKAIGGGRASYINSSPS
jgi:hypothetical protein